MILPTEVDLVRIVLTCLVLTLMVALPARAQTNDSEKVDSYGGIACDDAMARLDLFAQRLHSSPESVGYVVVYPEKNGLAGKFQSYGDYARAHLTMTSGIPSERITVLRGEYRDALTTELWLVPKDGPPPVKAVAADAQPQGTRKFDEGFADYVTTDGKQSLWTYDLCPLGAVDLKGFAEQLRSEPGSRGRIVIHSERGKSSARARVMARLLRSEMKQEHGIDSRRIVISTGGRSTTPSVELWIVSK